MKPAAKVAGPLAVLAVLGGSIWAGFDDAPGLVFDRISADEGFRADLYKDIEDVWTIGFGTNIGEGITRREGEFLLRERLAGTYQTLTSDLPWLSDAPERQQAAILDMGYQIGAPGLLKFHDMLSALEAGNCPVAKAAALDSEWARETPKRAERVTAILCED